MNHLNVFKISFIIFMYTMTILVYVYIFMAEWLTECVCGPTNGKMLLLFLSSK